MTAYIAGAVVVVLVVAGVIWTRLRAGHSDRRSMETYGHGMAALGDVTRRRSSSSTVRLLPGETHPDAPRRPEAPTASGTLAQATGPQPAVPPAAPTPHIAASGPSTRPAAFSTGSITTRVPGSGQPVTAPGGEAPPTEPDRPAEPPRAGRRPTVSIPLPGDELLFEDTGAATTEAGRSLRQSSRAPSGSGPWSFGRGGDGLGRQSTGRRLLVAGTVVVAVAAIVVAAILLTLHSSPRRAGGVTTTTRASASSTTTTTAVTTTTVPVLNPISTTASSATFALTRHRYILRFSTSTSACWVGVEPSAGAGTYLWSETLQAGSRGHYLASGPIAVQLGAPQYISVTLDGARLKIPAGVTYYELIFTSS